MNTQAYISKVKNRSVLVGIVGLGYVGLPLTLSFARAGIHVTAVDIDKQKIRKLLFDNESYIHHIPSQAVKDAIKSRRLLPTFDFFHLDRCDAIIICVPTPLNRNREPDMSYIEGTAKSIAPFIHKEQLIVLESTTYPGCTNEMLLPVLESISGLKAGKDFALAFSPEREDPGNAKFSTVTIPKIVGGYTEDCGVVASALYSAVMNEVVTVSCTKVAEMTKLYENIFRSVNIACANEFKLLCHAMNIDVFEVIEAAATKPFGFMPFYPGPGLGGHCIPIDPFYLAWKAREYEQPTRFIELAGEINTSMPHYVIERTALALNDHSKAVNGSKILVIGVAYKANIDDMRESPALAIIQMLQERGAQVAYHDPYVPVLQASREHDFRLSSVQLERELVQVFDAAVIVTAHTNVNYENVCEWLPLVIDCRNATRSVENKSKVVAA